MFVHNSLTNQKEKFEPINPNSVGLYCCGPSVYSYAHIGNARPVIVFDVLFRRLRLEYPHVTYVRNITDVHDKIILNAQKMGMSDINEAISILTTSAARRYHEDMYALGALAPTYEPKVTEHILEMQNMIGILIEKGFAYVSDDDHVLFHVPMLKKRYFSISESDHMTGAGHGKEVVSKRDPADFVLWKPSSANQPGWESPWGFGRPGWHIECSAMSAKYLGETFDIHGGGCDLIFPHHENEIAQSESAHGKKMANYWLHNGFVTVNGKKMAKSDGNYFTVHELIEEGWSGEVLRMALMSSHYRQPLNFTKSLLEQSFAILDGWYNAMRRFEFMFEPIGYTKGFDANPSHWRRKINPDVLAAIDDDMNMSTVFAIISEMIVKLNTEQSKVNTTINFYDLAQEIYDTVAFLGLFQSYPSKWLKTPQKPIENTLSADEIEILVGSRKEAKSIKNYEAADKIRVHLSKHNIALEDAKDGSTYWKYV